MFDFINIHKLKEVINSEGSILSLHSNNKGELILKSFLVGSGYVYYLVSKENLERYFETR